MIKIPLLEDDNKKLKQTVSTKYITLSDTISIDNSGVIPIELTEISSGVSVNELGKQLLKAAGDGDVEEIKLLLLQGAPFTANWLGTSPLHIAAANNNLEICETLLRAGISKDARTKVDRTPLHMAAYEGHINIVNTLLNHGADYECKDLLGMTPLHWGVQKGHAEVVRTLLARGAQTNVASKFNLTPLDIAYQINRHDLIELLNTDSTIAAENLVIQLAAESAENSNDYQSEELDMNNLEQVPVETILMGDEEEAELDDSQEEHESLQDELLESPEVSADQQDNTFSASMRILQEHGITMLPNDENNILRTVMESGHSVVLTDVGKEVLDSVKQQEAQTTPNRKIITVTAEEYLAMTNGTLNKNIFRPVKVISCKGAGKKIMMQKNKIIPMANTSQIQVNEEKKHPSFTDMELVMTQLIEARKTIEEYKIKLLKKEKEAERYKQQLKSFMENS